MPDETIQPESQASSAPPSGLNNYARVGRMTYFLGLLVPIVALPVLSIFYIFILSLRPDDAIRGLLIVIWAVSIFTIGIYATVLSVALAIKRFHDLDKSGWWILLMFVPLVSFFVQLWLLFGSGTPGSNTFGAAPVKRKLSDDLFSKLLTFGEA